MREQEMMHFFVSVSCYTLFLLSVCCCLGGYNRPLFSCPNWFWLQVQNVCLSLFIVCVLFCVPKCMFELFHGLCFFLPTGIILPSGLMDGFVLYYQYCVLFFVFVFIIVFPFFSCAPLTSSSALVVGVVYLDR